MHVPVCVENLMDYAIIQLPKDELKHAVLSS